MGFVVLRCTAKVLALLGTRASGIAAREASASDWYANLIWLERRKCLLVAHAGTLFSVFVPDVRKADLIPIGPVMAGLIERELSYEDLPLDRLGKLDPGSVTLAKTASRIVLGYMNEMARYCRYTISMAGGLERCDIDALNLGLRRELHLSQQPTGYLVPIDLVRGPIDLVHGQQPTTPSRDSPASSA